MRMTFRCIDVYIHIYKDQKPHRRFYYRVFIIRGHPEDYFTVIKFSARINCHITVFILTHCIDMVLGRVHKILVKRKYSRIILEK